MNLTRATQSARLMQTPHRPGVLRTAAVLPRLSSRFLSRGPVALLLCVLLASDHSLSGDTRSLAEFEGQEVAVQSAREYTRLSWYWGFGVLETGPYETGPYSEEPSTIPSFFTTRWIRGGPLILLYATDNMELVLVGLPTAAVVIVRRPRGPRWVSRTHFHPTLATALESVNGITSGTACLVAQYFVDSEGPLPGRLCLWEFTDSELEGEEILGGRAAYRVSRVTSKLKCRVTVWIDQDTLRMRKARLLDTDGRFWRLSIADTGN